MRYLRDRIISFAATLLLISAVTFFAVNVLPGDPALLILGTEGDPERLASLRQELGLNQPVLIRFAGWLTGMLRGDLGRSIRYSVDIAPLIKNALPVTLLLAVSGVGLALLISIPIGIGCAVRHGSLFETLSLVMTQFGMALPSFWLGLLLINLFALRLGILPPAGYTSGASLILPALALALPRAAVLIRVVRGSVLDALNQDYIRTARSKGLPQYMVLYKHALKNAAVSIAAVSGVQLTQLLGGTIVIEQVFGLPGLGQLLLAAALMRDLPLVQGLVVTSAALILAVNFGLDLLLLSLDPRLRYE